MKLDAADELHIVRHHVPLDFMAGDGELRAQETARRLSNRREHFREELFQRVRGQLAELALESTSPVGTSELIVDHLALGGLARDALLFLELGDAALQLLHPLADDLTELLRLRLQLTVAQRREPLLVVMNLVEDGLDALQLAIVSRAEERFGDSLEHDEPLSIQPGVADVCRNGIGYEPMK